VSAAEVDGLAAELERALGPGAVHRDASLAAFTTYQLGGPAAALVRADRPDDLVAVATARRVHRVALLVVGRGSNLLVADSGFPGLAVVLGEGFGGIDAGDDPTCLGAGGAVALPVLARRSVALGRTGLEFFVGIPGSVGGAVRMNAGGHGRETADVLIDATVADLDGTGSEVRRPVDALELAYRNSAVGPGEVVTAATFRVEPDDSTSGAAVIGEIVRWRREHQPGGTNAGSVFANPPGDSAGRIIDGLGLKGFRVGGATVSEKHANFFQAEPGATASDVHALVLAVQRRVREATGIELRPELRMVGFEDER
jgi:UDP-N-acetylmuramate dehydrogenase